MKIVLVNPPQSYPQKYYQPSNFRAHLPIGLLYVAGSLEKAGHRVSVIDAFTLGKGLKNYIESDQIYFGAHWTLIKERLIEHKPDLIGITSPYTPQMGNAVRVARIAKEINPNVPVIVGGPHASTRPQDFLLASDSIDYVVMGEGEETMVKLVEAINQGRKKVEVKGMAYRSNGHIVVNPKADFVEDLDRLSLPAYHLFDLDKYFGLFESGLKSRPYIESKRIVSLITSRGCPYNCIFCSIHIHMGRRWRAHSPAYVLDHIKYLVDRFGIEHICFEDDNFTLDRKRFEEILDGIIDSKLGITWDPPNGIRADSLDDRLVAKAKASGCTRLVVGVESGDQRVQDAIMGKKLNLAKVINFARICKKQDIGLHTFFMVGLPGETKKNISNTFKFAGHLMRRYNVIPSFGLAVPLVDTRLFKICEEKGYFARPPTSENLQLGLHFKAGGLIKTEEFDPPYLQRAIKRFFTKLLIYHLLNPWRIVRIFIRNPKLFFYKVNRLVNITFSKKIR